MSMANAQEPVNSGIRPAPSPNCVHNEDYKCRRCEQCYPCRHKQQGMGWICPDGVWVRTDMSGRIVEQLNQRRNK